MGPLPIPLLVHLPFADAIQGNPVNNGTLWLRPNSTDDIVGVANEQAASHSNRAIRLKLS